MPSSLAIATAGEYAVDSAAPTATRATGPVQAEAGAAATGIVRTSAASAGSIPSAVVMSCTLEEKSSPVEGQGVRKGVEQLLCVKGRQELLQ